MSSHSKSPSPPGGVKALLGKFENREDSSSSRGPSPAQRNRLLSNDSATAPTLATIRSSFVAVEPIKRPTTQSEARSGDGMESTAHKRRESFAMNDDADADAMAEMRRSISQELESRRQSGEVEPIPEIAVATPAIGREGTQLLGPDRPADTEVDETPPSTAKVPDDVAGASTSSQAGTDAPEIAATPEHQPKTDEMSGPSLPVTPSRDDAHDSTPEPSTFVETPDAKETPSEAGLPRKPDAPEPTETPQEVKARGTQNLVTPVTKPQRNSGTTGPSKRGLPSGSSAKASPASSRPNGSVRPSPHRSASLPHSGSPKAASTGRPAPARARSQNKRSDQPTTTSSTATGAVNGKVASKSPAHAQAPKERASAAKSTVSTAASTKSASSTAASTKAPLNGKDQGRAAATAVKTRTSVQAPTAASAAKQSAAGGSSHPAPAGAAARGGLQRQPSTRKETKPAGPRRARSTEGRHDPAHHHALAGASKAAHEGPSHKPATKPVNEGFLARMMRPTAASAKKAHEKAPAVTRPAANRAKSLPHRAKSAEHGKDGKSHGSRKATPEVKAEPKKEGKHEVAQDDNAAPEPATTTAAREETSETSVDRDEHMPEDAGMKKEAVEDNVAA